MKKTIRNSLVALLLILSGVVKGQETFHNIYFFDDSVAVISDVFPTDSGYYFSGTEVNNSNLRVEALFGRLNLDGSMNFFVRNIDMNSNQYVSFCRTQLMQDDAENFTFSAINQGVGDVPRILKYDNQGVKIMDTVYSDLWSSDSLIFYAIGRLVTNHLDSCHYLFFSYYDELNDDDNQAAVTKPGEFGVFLAKVNRQGEFVWIKRFANPSTANFKPSYFVMSLNAISDTTLLVSIRERKSYPSLSESQDWEKLHFFIVDSTGLEIEHQTFQDTQRTIGRHALLRMDSLIVFSNFISEYSPIPPNVEPSWRYRSVITCIDENYQLKWKDTLIPKFIINGYNSPNKLLQTSDSTFAGSFTYEYTYVNEDTTFYYTLTPVKLFNKSLETGEDVWTRNFRYFPEDSARRYTHEIIDIERTYDDGYIMCGSVISQDSLQANRPAQYGYVIKTNCLGFFGDPQTAASYNFGEENTVSFNNQSIQAGSYQWDFGDGTFLTTGEDSNAILHEYSATGIYTIQLIGFGCNGKSDTLNFTISFEYTEPGYAGDGTLLTLYPNPVSTGNSLAFYIGNLEEGNHYLNVFNSLGQRVDHFSITDANTNYLYPIDYAAGMYIFRLESNGEVVEIEKLVVE